MFTLKGEGAIEAVPVSPCFTLRLPPPSRAALSLDDAEAAMAKRRRAGEAHAWAGRAAGGEGARGPAQQQQEPASDDDDVLGGGGSGDDGGGAAGSGGGRRRRRGGGAKPTAEDWEHEGGMSDDDEAAGVADQMAEAEEEAAAAAAAAPRGAEAKSDDEADGGPTAGGGGLSEDGRAVHRLLMAQRARDGATGVEDELGEAGESDADDFEDDDFIDPDKDTQLAELIKRRSASDEAPAQRAVAPLPPAAAGGGAGAPSDAPPARAPKRPRSPDANGANGGAGAGAGPAKTARVVPSTFGSHAPQPPPPPPPPRTAAEEEAAALVAAIEADCGITLAEFRASLAGGGLTAVALTKHFRARLKTEVAKAGFKQLVQRFGKIEGGKVQLR